MKHHALVWLRNDLRINDNPALGAAAETGGHITTVYIHETIEAVRAPGGAARWWLDQSLEALRKQLADRSIELVIETGDPRDILPQLLTKLVVTELFWNRRYAPAERELDAELKAQFKENGTRVTSLPGNLLLEPWELKTGSNAPYQVFTPFAKALHRHHVPRPLPRRRWDIKPTQEVCSSHDTPAWSKKLNGLWAIGEDAARDCLTRFLEATLSTYAEDRDTPGTDGTSRLSPHLRFGEISARQAWYSTLAFMDEHHSARAGGEKFLSELIWRDFNYHQLFHRRDISQYDMRDTLSGIEWHDDPTAFEAWRRGQTGFPIIDAGMRQLWATGWMHNRVRMLVASFLTKNLLIDWRKGEEWFWDTLVDGDVASNPGSWQWVAGCGMDAAPYFRVFNPLLQGEKFDADGHYVRHWVPELSNLPNKWLHKPFEAPNDVLASAGLVLGDTYPKPLIDLRASQREARKRLNHQP
ncbi:deoxyribodipyrimidine photo-lyase [Ochrobactrum pecoris]|uniref:Deoxyribodipyrimidine photo-lyase n=1 Tax=Brucella pecoris TaxID=867683 RepID=A0A5C5CQA3_9HYPH|nr:deoxyribodipyrimidine photo-lyase [Brucella pecoris]MBB4093398.1 deoxyribodipyrimidine photo-lyase [Brucella pecoris]NKW81121.1 deoxyribodipyrimidine photo-lyase [Brucella pecoris]TNV13622.1 deoxyribodipyrimidine photo-lyase [Brucella pecoris]